jgi:hypothetical protein
MSNALLIAAARTVSGERVVPGSFGNILAGSFILVVSAVATEAADTLDVYIQSSSDGGNYYDDFIHFTQVLGNAAPPVKTQAFWNALMAPEAELAASADASMAVGVKQGPVGDKWRVKWVVAGDVPVLNASFTFAVSASLVRTK